MQTHWIERTVDGSTMPCYVAEPDGTPKAAVLILQEIFGVNAPMQKLTELVASVGYLGIAPALFHRTDPHFEAAYDGPGFAKGAAAAGSVTFAGAIADMESAIAYARERIGSHAKIATWGFCFGGSIAFVSATMREVSAALSFYGGQIAPSSNASRPAALSLTDQVRAPLFFAFGGRDEHIPSGDHDAIRAALDEHHKPYEFYVMPDADHGFFRHGPHGNASSAEIWPRVQRFLTEHVA